MSLCECLEQIAPLILAALSEKVVSVVRTSWLKVLLSSANTLSAV